MLFSISAKAAVVYANCPTLSPLPVVNFMPGAMIPIQNAQMAFDVGMNVTIKNAVTYAATTQVTSINSNFSALIESTIKLSRSQHQQEMEIEKQFARMKQAYESELNGQLQQIVGRAFPSDPIFSDDPEISGSTSYSPTLVYARNMCTMAKMNQYSNKKETKDRVTRSINRRNQKITSSIQAVSNVNASAKRTTDMHYEMFCSQEDLNNALCDTVSVAPNADLSAFNFLYPSGFISTNESYQTAYTYSPVESLAAYQYIRHLTGSIYVAPPTESEKRDNTKALFTGVYQQTVSAMSMVSDVLLEISQLREPINESGTPLSKMDVLAYQLEQSVNPDNKRIISSSTETGKRIEIQKQMAINNQLRLLLMKQKDAQRRLQAADLSLSSTIETLQ